jgi:DNA polymerase III subunit delta
VVLEETEQLAQSPKARDRVLDAARNPPEGVALILSCTPPSGSTAKFYGDLAKAARSMEFRSVPESDLPAWLMERGREAHGVEVEEAAARALAQAVGSELGILNHELKKLAGMVDPGGVITLKEVEAAGTRIPRQDRWAWFDLVAERRTDRALEGLRILLTHGDSGVGLTLGLATHFLRLGLAASDPQALQRALPPRQAWLADKMRRQAKLWSREEIRAAIEGLYRVDRLLKASGLSDQHLMEGWLLEQEFSRTQAA